MENLDPVLGVARWAAVAVERVARSKALRRRVSHRREAAPFPLGSTLPKEGRVFMLVQRERDSQTRGGRESVHDDSGPRSTWRWRRTGEITHRSVWNLI